MCSNYELTCTEHICMNYLCDLLDCNTLRIRLVAWYSFHFGACIMSRYVVLYTANVRRIWTAGSIRFSIIGLNLWCMAFSLRLLQSPVLFLILYSLCIYIGYSFFPFRFSSYIAVRLYLSRIFCSFYFSSDVLHSEYLYFSSVSISFYSFWLHTKIVFISNRPNRSPDWFFFPLHIRIKSLQ